MERNQMHIRNLGAFGLEDLLVDRFDKTYRDRGFAAALVDASLRSRIDDLSASQLHDQVGEMMHLPSG